MKYTFIVNPKASSGNGELIWNQIAPELIKRQIDYEVRFTDRRHGATEAAAEVTADGKEHMIVVVGGDGTMNEVVNGIQECGKVTLGCIPTGSGNDFIRAVRLPKDPMSALETVLKRERVVPLDIGEMISGGEKHRFAVSTGIGFDAAVCHHVAVTKLKALLNKFKAGSLIYLGIALQRLMREPLVNCRLRLDGGETKRFEKTYFVAVMNHPYEGGGFFFCPKAEVGDGCLDVIVVSGLPRIKVLFLLPTAFFGKHVNFKGIDIYRCKKAEIELDTALPVHTDGEVIPAADRMTASLCEKQARLIVRA